MKAPQLFSNADRDLIHTKITGAEQLTSGEVRVYIEDECSGDVMDRAAFVFAELKMHKTELRNGVLIYLATSSKKFAIIGDQGINQVVPSNFWIGIKDEMSQCFQQGLFTKGISLALEAIGIELKKHFPISKQDKNELPNDIVFGGNDDKN